MVASIKCLRLHFFRPDIMGAGGEGMTTIKVTEGVYQIAGPELSAPEDCCAYLVDLGRPILIDTGSGADMKRVVSNLESLEYSPKDISLIIFGFTISAICLSISPAIINSGRK